MATSTGSLTDTARADRYLDYLEREWAALAAVAAEWDSWDEADRLDFQLEWPIREDRLAALREVAGRRELSAGQLSRLKKLERLVAARAPLLDKLFCSPEAPGRPGRA